MNIAIDGPAGAGKSTVAKIVADRLNYVYIDTGAMYRALAWAVLYNQLPVTDEQAVVQLLKQADIQLQRTEQGSLQVLWNGEDITQQIRTPEISQMASVVASYPDVRKQMLHLQRSLAQRGDVVMDGRDIGTHVLPDAEVKIFLTASIEERARRRYEEMAAKGLEPDLEQLLLDIAKRDQRDSQRAVAPLKQADDAHVIDTTGMSIEAVVREILRVCEQVGNRP